MFKAAILTKFKKIELQEFITPAKLRDDQVLVKINYTGICGSQIMEFWATEGKITIFHMRLDMKPLV